MKIYLVRHGRTIANFEKRLIGKNSNPSLMEFGKKQVFVLKEQLNDVRFERLISSPLNRAVESAKILSKRNDIIFDERLIERDYGVFEGKTKNELITLKEQYQLVNENISNYFPSQIGAVEMRSNVSKRVQNLIFENKKRFGDESTVAYITHAGVIFCLLTDYFGIPEEYPEAFKIREASYIKCIIDENNNIKVFELWNNPLQ